MRRRRPRPDHELLAAGDGAAFGEFYERHERAVLVFMLRRTSTPELAADLTAEVFAAALESADRFEGRDGASAVAWLFGIARNVLSHSYRSARVRHDARDRLGLPALDLTDETVEHLEHLADVARGADALVLLDRLPAEHRDAVVAHVLDGRDYAEIARELGCSTAVVRQRVSRGLSTLRGLVPPA
ncbi:RNA polymerase sigma factor [Patulibacter minatonensis]|uniref:RNA polymerase sigma factor n=1 Tax=Patulibacter minatonensis TaxID=298163 RepID=UPI000686CACD|nr:sigma-70 family RNA polymerase sigma factor [Patulibacter minatonensis]